MKKAYIIKEVAKKAEVTQATCERVIDAYIDFVLECLEKEEHFKIDKLGSFYVKILKASILRNKQTGQMYEIPSRKRIKFKISKKLFNLIK